MVIRHSLLLEVILTRATRLAAWERAFVVALSRVYARVASKVATGCEGPLASPADVFSA